MDLSKLPRLSKTDRPPNPPEQPETPTPQQQTFYYAEPEAVVGAEVWISIVVAVILILFFPRIWQYYLMPNSFTWSFSDKAGNPLAYTHSAYYLVDLGIAIFAIILLLDALAMICTRSAIVRGIALTITAAGSLFNLAVLVAAINQIGLQIMPVVAAGFGIYIAAYQWLRLKRTLALRASSR